MELLIASQYLPLQREFDDVDISHLVHVGSQIKIESLLLTNVGK